MKTKPEIGTVLPATATTTTTPLTIVEVTGYDEKTDTWACRLEDGEGNDFGFIAI